MKTRSGLTTFHAAMVMLATSLGVALLDLVATAKYPVHDTPAIVVQMMILAVAVAQVVAAVGFGAVGLALRSSPGQRGPRIAFWTWTAVALPVLVIGGWVGFAVLCR